MSRRKLTAVVAGTLLADPVVAHAAGLSGSLRPVPVPSWLVVVTGGGVIGASFLLTSLVTDHAFIRAVTDWRVTLPTEETVQTAVVWSTRGLSVCVLAAVVAVGLVGPRIPVANLAVVVVWAGWWAGYTTTTYLVGNTWPAVNPWRALATLGSRLRGGHVRTYPERLGAWPSVAGLLLLVWLEVVSPVAQRPRALVAVIVAYSVVTVVGAMVYGVETWFGVVDPIARVFRWYGRVAPFQRTETGIEWTLPGGALAGGRSSGGADETAFVVALLWVTTYDGLVATPTWNTAARAVDAAGIPPVALYLVTILAGFFGFLAVYRLAARYSRRTANSYVTARFIRDWFAPALLPIAAGYHLAHYLGYFLSLTPVLVAVGLHPLSPPVALTTLVLPAWFGTLQLGFVLAGHLLAVWVAHARSFAVFPGRLEPIRSQYPFILVMVLYTVTSMWVVAQPFTQPYV